MFPPLKGTCIGIYDYTTGPYNVTGGANVEIAFKKKEKENEEDV